MRHSLFIFIYIIILLEGCTKSDSYTSSIIIENDEIYLDSSNRIFKIIIKNEDKTIKWISNFKYYDTIIVKSTFYPDSIYQISTFFLGKNGYAKSMIDTVHDHLQISIYINEYQYDSAEYLKIWLSDNYPNNFYEKEGDLLAFNNYKFSYYDSLNKIDIFWFPFYNGIIGKTYKHLIKEKYGYFGLGSYQNSIYQYSLDLTGYILEMKETRNYGNITQHTNNIEYYETRYKYYFNNAP